MSNAKKPTENGASGDLIARSIAWTKNNRVRVGKTAKDNKRRGRNSA